MKIPATETGQTANRLLAALAPADFKRIRPSLERADMVHGHTIVKTDAPVEHVYFPESGMVSLVQPLKDGTLIEVGVVGKEGMVGSQILLGSDRWPVQAVVQMPGVAVRLPAKLLLEVTRRNPAFYASLLRFTQALFVHISQSAACNARHKLEQRLARWLLVAHDRAGGDELQLSHEFLANMLGIRRAGVTTALSKFKARQLIATGRGRVTILGRQGIEDASCECYATVKRETGRLLKMSDR